MSHGSARHPELGIGSEALEADAWRAVLLAATWAAAGVILGGASAVIAVAAGANASLALTLMAVVVAGGLTAAGVVLLGSRRRLRRHQSVLLLERQLSARYGVPVHRLAWHVWRVDGELVEATFDSSTGRLSTGGHELTL